MSTKVTCSARRESRPKPVTRLNTDRLRATKDAMVMDRMTTSSPGAGMERSSQSRSSASCTWAQATPTAVATTSKAISDL